MGHIRVSGGCLRPYFHDHEVVENIENFNFNDVKEGDFLVFIVGKRQIKQVISIKNIPPQFRDMGYGDVLPENMFMVSDVDMNRQNTQIVHINHCIGWVPKKNIKQRKF